jgi:hypothetical protein
MLWEEHGLRTWPVLFVPRSWIVTGALSDLAYWQCWDHLSIQEWSVLLSVSQSSHSMPSLMGLKFFLGL